MNHSRNFKNLGFIVISLTFFLFNLSTAEIALHEIGIGPVLSSPNDNVKKAFGIDVHYDYTFHPSIILKLSVGGLFSKTKTNFLTEGSYSLISVEESILYRITSGKLEHYIGIGLGYYIINHNMSTFVKNYLFLEGY